MHRHVFQSCLNVAGKLCVDVIRPVCLEISTPKFRFLSRTRCTVGYVFFKQNYCTSNKCTSSRPSVDDISQEKLDELLQDAEKKKQYQILQLEIDVIRYNGERVPDNIRPRDWLTLLDATTKSQRRRYLDYAWRIEKRRESVLKKKEIKKTEAAMKNTTLDETDHIQYGLCRNTFFLRFYETAINQFYNNKVIQAMMFDPIVVFDLGYQNYMTQAENTNCVTQLILSFAINRTHKSPLNLYFCNIQKPSYLMEGLERGVPTINNPDFPLNITSQSYLDLFDKSKLVYLTPHTNNVMKEYDPDMIYIIGAMVDKRNRQPLSLAKAKREGIRTAKFPLDRYLEWGSGSGKSLTLNQSLSILLDLHYTKCWKTALTKNVPVRKLKFARDMQLKQKIMRHRFRGKDEHVNFNQPQFFDMNGKRK